MTRFRGLAGAILVMAAFRDVLIVVVGLLTLLSTPPSLVELGFRDALAVVWSLMLAIGAGWSLYGLLAQRPTTEIAGAFTVAGGFAVWAAAAFFQPDPTPVSYAVAAVLAGGALGQLHKGLIAISGALATRPPTPSRGRR